MGYDVIGDVHGQAGKLKALLRKMGYAQAGGRWVPPHGRQAVFVGDLIDRGPEQVEVLRIVRGMMDAGHAHAVMGNHEFNAIGYVTPDPNAPGKFLRPHTESKVAQHAEFLAQVGEGTDLHRELVDWFRSLPVALDLGGIRVVHAWWHAPYIERASALAPGKLQDDDFLHAAYAKKSVQWKAMEGLTKGLEIRLPEGHSFVDHTNTLRHDVRVRWWDPDARTFRQAALVDHEQRQQVPDLPMPEDFVPVPVEGSPLFVGHYWMSGVPTLQSPKLACLDWGAALQGPLVAYRWDGEIELEERRLVQAG